MRVEVGVKLNGLGPEDVVVEMLISLQSKREKINDSMRYRFQFNGVVDGGEHRFSLEMNPELCGRLEYRVRVHPYHPLLTHPLEMGFMAWA